MMNWWKEMDRLSKDTKVAVPVVHQVAVDPISSAVANVGYAPVPAPTTLEAPSTPIRSQLSTTDSPSPMREGSTSTSHLEEDDDEGGSSAEEEEELARTAPTTPYHATELSTSPLDAEGERQYQKEVLPIYAGDGTTVSILSNIATVQRH